MCKDRLTGRNVCPFLQPSPRHLGAGGTAPSPHCAPPLWSRSLGAHSSQVVLFPSRLRLWSGRAAHS